jgi:hypothetical protein
MTTLIMEFPDNASSAISSIIKDAEKAGAFVHIENEEDLSPAEFELLKESYKEALLIKDGVVKAIPASELWND